MLTQEEQKLAVCEKLPELIRVYRNPQFPSTPSFLWLKDGSDIIDHRINWPTEGLQVCHEAEKLLTDNLTSEAECLRYVRALREVLVSPSEFGLVIATYKQRLEALCRVWWPERFV
jgi:hypothetical protein